MRDGDPTDEDWEVYGDLLQERGDPRGELVALSLASDRTADDVEHAKLERRLATLSRRIDPDLHERARRAPSFFDLAWDHGFVARARVVEPWNRSDAPVASWLSELLASPAGRFVRELSIDREAREDVTLGNLGQRGIYEWAAPLFEGLALPQLRTLRIGGGAEIEHLSETSSAMMTTRAPGTPGARIFRPDRYVGDVSAALRAAPRLTRLAIEGEGTRVAELPSSLTSLTIRTRFLRKSTLRAIAAAPLPSLRSLELWLGHWPDSVTGFRGPETEEYYGPSTGADDLAPLLAGDAVPALRSLALSNCAWMPALVFAIAESAILERLVELDLSYGFMDGSGVRPILDRAERFRRLRRLDLSHNQIDEATQQRLRDAFGRAVVLDPQEELSGSAALRLLSF